MKYTSKRLTVIFFLAHRPLPCAPPFALRTAIARLAPCASSRRKPLPCAPLSLGSRRALRPDANAIVFLAINRISESAQGHLAPTAYASLASENAVSISKIRCICCEFCGTTRNVSRIKRTRTSRTCALVFHLITSKASPICLP